MKCPRCDVAIKEVILDDIVLDQCEECGGIWFDFAELDRVLNRDIMQARKVLPKRPKNEDMSVEVLPCSRCSDKIIRMHTPNRKIVYYGCLTCYGRWLDGNELKRILDRPLAIKFERLFQELLD